MVWYAGTMDSQPLDVPGRRGARGSASFVVRIDSELTPDVAWDRILDLSAHSRLIPFTTLRGPGVATGLTAGSTFEARTGWRRMGFDDPMIVESWRPPAGEQAGRCVIRKTGRTVTGVIELTVGPAPGGSSVLWSQRIGVRGVPAIAAPIVRVVAERAYRHTIRRLLAHPSSPT